MTKYMLIAGLWLLSFCVGKANDSGPRIVQVNTAVVKLIREVEIPAQTSGALGKVEVQEGQRIQAGDLVAEIVDTKVRFDVKRRQLELTAAQAKYRSDFAVTDAELAAALATTEYNRVIQANEIQEDTYRQAEVDRYKLQKDRADVAVEKAKFEQKVLRLDELVAQNELDAASQLLDLFSVKAPWSGTVVSVNVVAGAWVEAGTSVAKIVDTSRLRVEGFVSSEYTTEELLQSKTTVRFTPSSGETVELPGKVVFVSPDVNTVNYQARIHIEVDNVEEKLRPGWKVEVELQLPPVVAANQ